MIFPHFPRRVGVLALAALLTLEPALLTAAETLPTLGDPSATELSPQAERKVGEEIMREARAEGDIFDDQESTEYLNQFGANLIAHAPPTEQSFEFFLVLDPNINAFALPGGHIGVNTGLIVAAQSESELASVMSHEMGHVIQRHIARSLDRQAQTSPIALAAMILGVLAMAKSNSPDAGEAAVAMGQNYLIQDQLKFSRDAEREADRVGFQILHDSGFDVDGMATFFQRLQQATRIDDTGAPEWLRDHPMTTERIADIQNRIKVSHYHQRPDSPDFQFVRARLRVLQDPSIQGLHDSVDTYKSQLHDGTYPSEAAAHYGLALAELKLGNVEVAQKELDAVKKLFTAPNSFVTDLEVGVKVAEHDNVGALAAAQAGFSAMPQSRAMASRYAESLQRLGRHDEAIHFLRDQIDLYHDEYVFYDLLAKSYEAKNQGLLEHQALAEEYVLRGGLASAIEQLKLARKAGAQSDFYELSQVDARLRDLEAQWKDIQKEQKNGKRSGFAVSFQAGPNPGGEAAPAPLPGSNSLFSEPAFSHAQAKDSAEP